MVNQLEEKKLQKKRLKTITYKHLHLNAYIAKINF